MGFGAAVGSVLRKLRTDRGLTLHAVQELSKGVFKASALSGYERGERSISLEKFQELTAIYSVSADDALAEVLKVLGVTGAPRSVIDLTEKNIGLRESTEAAAPGREG